MPNGRKIELEDALRILTRRLREGDASSHGYDLHVATAVRRYAELDEGLRHLEVDQRVRELSATFLEAAWLLSQRAIVRPGVTAYQEDGTNDGRDGGGFSLTTLGSAWINEGGDPETIPVERNRFNAMIEAYVPRFENAFGKRAREAHSCYFSRCYLACCAMSGAAAESILLATASVKLRSEEEALSRYRRANGRRNLENLVTGNLREPLGRDFLALTGLLSYWRDTAAHGAAQTLGEHEAFVSLSLLLKSAGFVDRNWDELTA